MLNNSYIQIKMDESISIDIYSNIAYYNYNANKDNNNKVIQTSLQNYLLSTGSLLLDPEAFNGFIFIDKYWNIYDTINKELNLIGVINSLVILISQLFIYLKGLKK